MEYVLGIDLGTSYFKIGIIDTSGKLRGLGRIAVPISSKENDKWECNVHDFISIIKQGIAEACEQAAISLHDISAISYSSQANSFLLLDQHDEPLTPLILWPDMRTKTYYPSIWELCTRDDFLEVTGLGMKSEGFAVNKLGWFKDKCPELWSRVARFMSISDYLTFSLVGEPRGDCSTASLLGIWDMQAMQYWDDALRMVGISRNHVSTLLRPGTVAGKTKQCAQDNFGLPVGIPVAVGGLDHYIAAVGAGLGNIAPVSESMGTVLALLQISDEYLPQTGCSIGPAAGEKPYYKLAFNNNGSVHLEWYQKNFASEYDLEELNRFAQKTPIGSNGLLAKPLVSSYNGLEGFVDQEKNRQSLSHGHYVRAIMESVAGSLRELLDNLSGNSYPERIVATGGGAKSTLWLQILSDVTHVEFVTSKTEEPATLGAGMMAAVAAGWFADIDTVPRDFHAIEKTVSPNRKAHQSYNTWLERFRTIV
jgi:sugar (pentulose or hexulose) kinase